MSVGDPHHPSNRCAVHLSRSSRGSHGRSTGVAAASKGEGEAPLRWRLVRIEVVVDFFLPKCHSGHDKAFLSRVLVRLHGCTAQAWCPVGVRKMLVRDTRRRPTGAHLSHTHAHTHARTPTHTHAVQGDVVAFAPFATERPSFLIHVGCVSLKIHLSHECVTVRLRKSGESVSERLCVVKRLDLVPLLDTKPVR